MATNAMGYGGNYQTWDYATTDFIYLGFNTASGICRAPRCAWPSLRPLTARPLPRPPTPATPFLRPPGPPDSSLSPRIPPSGLSYDPDTLAQQLEELGLAGARFACWSTAKTRPKCPPAQLIAYQLGSAGLTVKVEQLSYEDFTAALSKGDFDLYLGETVLTADFDLSPCCPLPAASIYRCWSNTYTARLSPPPAPPPR